MSESDYPAGAYYDDNAPWNQTDDERTEEEIQDEYESFKEDMKDD